VNIDLSTSAPPSPERTRHLAETMAEIMRVLNHQTLHHEAFGEPADVDRLIREVSSAVSRIPQLIHQAGAWLKREQDEGRIEVAAGTSYASALAAVRSAVLRLGAADPAAEDLAEVLTHAASVTTDLARREDGTDE
jgi:hypothetical protein